MQNKQQLIDRAKDWLGGHRMIPTDGMAVQIIRDLVAEIERDKWLPISEAPRDGTKLLLGAFNKGNWYEVLGRDINTNIPCGFREYIRPTHYQPLPLPPTNTETKENDE